MKITRLETIRIDEHANICWVQVHTDEGQVELGETFFGARAVEAYVHETAAPLLLGKDPLQIDRIGRALSPYVGFSGAGAEMRGNSAIDIALWDLFGKVTGQPIAQLLGGFTRQQIRTYNTCAGTTYMREGGQTVANYGLSNGRREYADLDAFLNRADELAEDLLSEGITAMKIWPFDVAAEKTSGHYISAEDLRAALSPFEKFASGWATGWT